ncbi:MAG: ferrous iron transport protein A [Bacteroidia bacterium]|nr:ferrous iron transport protein A [Bacteroidia bacterium]
MRERNRHRGQRRVRLTEGSEGHLSDLECGQKAIVVNFHNDNPALRRRLLDMGITKGVVVEIKKIAPLGDPVDISLRGYELCIRRSDMKSIDIKVIE